MLHRVKELGQRPHAYNPNTANTISYEKRLGKRSFECMSVHVVSLMINVFPSYSLDISVEVINFSLSAVCLFETFSNQDNRLITLNRKRGLMTAVVILTHHRSEMSNFQHFTSNQSMQKYAFFLIHR